jgi:hypothetical protein
MRTRLRDSWSRASATPTTTTGPRHGQAGASCHVLGRQKTSPPVRLNAAAAGQEVYMVYQLKGRRLSVHTGFSFSILPHQSTQQATGPSRLGRDPCPAEVQRPALRIAYLQAPVKSTILGVDFLKNYRLTQQSCATRVFNAIYMALNTLSREPLKGCFARRWPDMAWPKTLLAPLVDSPAHCGTMRPDSPTCTWTWCDTSEEGYHYQFIMVDKSTRLLEAVPLCNIKMSSCMEALVGTWVARFSRLFILT